MKILFVVHNDGFYGANKALLELMTNLRDTYDITPVVLMSHYGIFCEVLKDNNIKCYVSHYYWWLNKFSGPFEKVKAIRKQLKNFFSSFRIKRLVENEKNDLIYSNSLCVSMGYLLAKRLNLPHIWHIRESLSSFQYPFSLPESLTKKMLKSQANKRFVLISDYMMNFYADYLPKERMVRIYDGVEVPKLSRNVQEHKKLQVACVGIVSPNKNQIELLQAQHLLKNKGIEIETWFIGDKNPPSYLQKCLSFAHNNGIEKNVHFVGHKDNVFEVLQNMDLGVVCSKDEAFGRTTVEFMMMQIPVVVSRSGANTELMQDGVHGFSYELGNIQAFADKIETYVKNRDLIIEQGRKAQEYAKQHFAAERNAADVYRLIMSVLEQERN